MPFRNFLCTLLLLVTGTSFAADKTYTCINEKGEKLFSIKCYSVGKFSCGLAEVQKIVTASDGKAYYRSGFINDKGETVIECKYDKAYAFSYGVSWVKDPSAEGYYLINKKGERLTTQSWKRVSYFFEGHCAVFDDNDNMGFVNRFGKLVIPCKYLGDGFSEGLACVMPMDSKDEKYGFIDTTGKAVIPFQYKQAGTSSFDNGECRVQINGMTCLINKKGEVVFKPTLTKNGQGFYDDLCASYTNGTNRSGWGFYNRQNQWVIKPVYDNANSFINGHAIVEKAGKTGVIDKTGKEIIPIKYASVFSDPDEDGYYTLMLEANGNRTYVTKDNKPFTTVSVKWLMPSNFSLIPYCSPDGKYGYLNRDGSLFMNAQFDWAGTFYEGKAWVEGNTDALKTAAGAQSSNFAADFKVGDKVKGNWKGKGTWYPGTIKEIGKSYYLVLYDDGDQEWVSYDNLKLLRK